MISQLWECLGLQWYLDFGLLNIVRAIKDGREFWSCSECILHYEMLTSLWEQGKNGMTDFNMVCFGIKWTRDRDVIVDIVTWQGK